MPMMYLPDCIKATILCLEAPSSTFTDEIRSAKGHVQPSIFLSFSFNVVLFLCQRTYNVQAVSFTPGELVAEMKKYFPNMEVTYEPDERQAIGV